MRTAGIPQHELVQVSFTAGLADASARTTTSSTTPTRTTAAGLASSPDPSYCGQHITTQFFVSPRRSGHYTGSITYQAHHPGPPIRLGASPQVGATSSADSASTWPRDERPNRPSPAGKPAVASLGGRRSTRNSIHRPSPAISPRCMLPATAHATHARDAQTVRAADAEKARPCVFWVRWKHRVARQKAPICRYCVLKSPEDVLGPFDAGRSLVASCARVERVSARAFTDAQQSGSQGVCARPRRAARAPCRGLPARRSSRAHGRRRLGRTRRGPSDGSNTPRHSPLGAEAHITDDPVLEGESQPVVVDDLDGGDVDELLHTPDARGAGRSAPNGS